MDPSMPVLTQCPFQKLASDLLTETSAQAISLCLNAIIMGLGKDQELGTGGQGPVKFLRVGGLPAVIRHLRGTATSGATRDAWASEISDAAGSVLGFLLCQNPLAMAEIMATTGIVPQLIDALCDAPVPNSRAMAAATLRILALAQPAQCRAMADAGVIKLIVALYTEVGEHTAMLEPTTDLGAVLMCSEPVAARDVKQAICGKKNAQNYAALVLLQVSHLSSHAFHYLWNPIACRQRPLPSSSTLSRSTYY